MNTRMILPPGLWSLHLPYLQALGTRPQNGAGASAQRAEQDTAPGKPYAMQAGMAVIPVRGTLTGEPDLWDLLFGGVVATGTADRVFRQAVSDPAVTSILLDFHSPGGEITGISAFAAAIRQGRARKPVVAYAQDLCCSAALWLATQASAFYAGDTATIGSIGIIMGPIIDASEALAKEGVKVFYPATGAFKAAGAIGSQITQDHLDFFDSHVAAVGDHFIGDIGTGRKMPITDVRKLADGRFWVATEARDSGLFDGVASREEVMRKMQRGEITTRRDQPAAQSGKEGKTPMKLWGFFTPAPEDEAGNDDPNAALQAPKPGASAQILTVQPGRAGASEHPVLTAALAAGIDTPEKLAALQAGAKHGDAYLADLRAKALAAATTCIGADKPERLESARKAIDATSDPDLLTALETSYQEATPAALRNTQRISAPTRPAEFAADATRPDDDEQKQGAIHSTLAQTELGRRALDIRQKNGKN